MSKAQAYFGNMVAMIIIHKHSFHSSFLVQGDKSYFYLKTSGLGC